MDTLLIIYILFAHWVADFIFQDEKWAVGKRTSIKALLSHTTTYSFVMAIMLSPFLLSATPLFLFYCFITHTIIDYFTSKWVGNKFIKKELGSSIPNFGAFSIIGLDQLIHYTTLFLYLQYFLW